MTMSKEKLRDLANEIKALLEHERGLKQPFIPTVSFELGEWFVHAVESFLLSEQPDLEKALGLTRKQGPPRQGREAKNYPRAVKVHKMLCRKPPATKDEILDVFPDANWKDLQDEQERYAPDISADKTEAIAAGISARIDARIEKRRRKRLGIKDQD
jgi:hypothetical protein